MRNELDLVNIYSWITPIVIVLILAEIAWCIVKKNNFIRFQDAITNLGTGIGNQCVNLLVAFIVIKTFGYLYEYRFWTIPTTISSFIVLLVLFDFLFYWYHRHNHTINFLWAAHMPHHTSEEFNMFVAVRASITQRIFSFTYLWPLVLIGFTPEAIYAASAVQLLIAFWHHTRTIGRMKWFEEIFNSPSHHRVHHAINDKYLDKNFGEIFIIWDKLFGTFKREEEEPVYGALTQVNSWNPNRIYFQYWSYLWEDAVKTKRFRDKIKLWFMPLGWRPEDRRSSPRKRVNSENIIKFDTPLSNNTKNYLIFSSLITLVIMSITINLKLPLLVYERVFLSILIWVGITNWGGILENKKWAINSDLLFIVAQLMIINFIGLRLELQWILQLSFLTFAAQLTVHWIWRSSKVSAQYMALRSRH